MKYRCNMCGHEVEGNALPTIECPACGSKVWEVKPFDKRCAKCGQGYYDTEEPNFCPNCGNPIAAPAPAPATRRSTGRTRTATPRPTTRPATHPSRTPATHPSRPPATPTPAPVDRSWLKFNFKVLAWIIGIVLACWLGYYVVVWTWAVLCFIARHWIISLIVVFFVIGAMSKD